LLERLYAHGTGQGCFESPGSACGLAVLISSYMISMVEFRGEWEPFLGTCVVGGLVWGLKLDCPTSRVVGKENPRRGAFYKEEPRDRKESNP
jgi:hypothetical protein